LVGMQGMMIAPFNIHGQCRKGVWLGNLMALPEVRSQGVGLQLMLGVHRLGFDAVCTLGINDYVRRIYEALGYEILAEAPRWVAVIDVHQTASLLGIDELEIPKGFSAREPPRVPDVQVADLMVGQLDRWDECWSESFAPRIIGTGRQGSFLKWRYAEHPRFRYSMRVARRRADQQLLGLAVWRVEQVRDRTERVLRLVEFLSLPEGVTALVGDLVGYAKAQAVAFADFYGCSPALAAGLMRAGFHCSNASSHELFPCRFQPLDPRPCSLAGAFRLSADLRRHMGPVLAAPEFYATKSDGDMDRPN